MKFDCEIGALPKTTAAPERIARERCARSIHGLHADPAVTLASNDLQFSVDSRPGTL